MKYFAVIDTNVIVSAALYPRSVPGLIFKEAVTGRIIPLIHEDIIKEYKDVLSRKKFKFAPEYIWEILEGMKKRGILLNPAEITEEMVDDKDVIFYQIVMEGREACNDAYLVTGNIKHFPVKHYVVTPREMLAILDMEDNKTSECMDEETWY